MIESTGIEWSEGTWNPCIGCSKISSGCKHCYAARIHEDLRQKGIKKYAEPFTTVRPWRAALKKPLFEKQPKRIFVNSMSDLFHEDLPLEYIREVFDVMKQANWHTFQVLTKRSTRLRELARVLDWHENVWVGVTVEDATQIQRVIDLQEVPARCRMLSIEPLIAPISNLPLDGIHWVIVGGESGRNARPMAPEWVREIRDQCVDAGVPFFFKQWGGPNKKRAGRELDGRTWSEYPVASVK
jgi:protein gp37